jgi:hypothetical protein
MILVSQYLLVGVIIAFLLEIFMRWTDTEVNMWERLSMIAVWPIMIAIFMWHFLTGLFGKD